jgi:hypothetical protein
MCGSLGCRYNIKKTQESRSKKFKIRHSLHVTAGRDAFDVTSGRDAFVYSESELADVTRSFTPSLNLDAGIVHMLNSAIGCGSILVCYLSLSAKPLGSLSMLEPIRCWEDLVLPSHNKSDTGECFLLASFHHPSFPLASPKAGSAFRM